MIADKLREIAERARWRPITEIHEDLGICILVNIDDSGYMELGNNLDLDWDESQWTHFAQIPLMTDQDYERMIAEAAMQAGAREGGEG